LLPIAGRSSSVRVDCGGGLDNKKPAYRLLSAAGKYLI
jgi:hypothetical protein